MSDRRIPIAVLASGRGSNFDAILQATRSGRLQADIRAVVSDRPEAEVLNRAREAGIAALAVPPMAKGNGAQAGATKLTEAQTCATKLTRAEHERAILQALEPYGIRFLVMAGYMRIVTTELLSAFRSERGYFRVVNVHPSLLPAFSGVNAYAQAYEHGAKLAGVTIHLVDDVLDGGPICAQEAFRIDDCKNVEEVERRGLAIEHRLYPETLNWILPEKFQTLKGMRRLRVHAN